jgi:hypothetical protein
LSIRTKNFGDGECALKEIEQILDIYRYSIDSLNIRAKNLDNIKEKDVQCVFKALKSHFNLIHLSLNFSKWRFSVLEDVNRYLSELAEQLTLYPELRSLHLCLAWLEYTNAGEPVDIEDHSLTKIA